jgi:hypothetical protein
MNWMVNWCIFLVFHAYSNEMHDSRSKIPGKNLVRQRCGEGFNSGVKGLKSQCMTICQYKCFHFHSNNHTTVCRQFHKVSCCMKHAMWPTKHTPGEEQESCLWMYPEWQSAGTDPEALVTRISFVLFSVRSGRWKDRCKVWHRWWIANKCLRDGIYLLPFKHWVFLKMSTTDIKRVVIATRV